MGRLRHIKGAEEAVENSPFVIHVNRDGAQPFIDDPGKYFGGQEKRPLFIEIGMGKGRFIMEMAERFPERNFIGIERYESVLLKAISKYEAAREAGASRDNLIFLCEDAGLLDRYFREGSIDGIYLNFSDPWPKKKHAGRRLVSEGFLKLFHTLLTDEGLIEFKTDNVPLFDFALTQYEAAGFQLVAMTRDLHADEQLNDGNVMTEYEEKFSERGNRINKLIIKKV